MNKHEKEVIKAQLMSEKQTLRTIQAVYKKALQDVENKLVISNGKINTLLKDVDNLSDEEKSILQSQIYQRKMQRSLKSQLEIMLKDLAVNQYGTINEYLRNSYQNGYIGALYNLNMQGMPLILPIDPYLVHRAIEIDSKIKHGLYLNLVDKVDVFKRRIANDISRGIASSTSYHDMATWIRHGTKVSIGKSMRIVRTEGNRIYNAAALDCGKGAKERGCDLVKVWDSTLDMKTRPTHRECDGQVRELNEDFKNANGEAKAPGQFGIASEDINCRCAVLIKPRWDVDSRFTKRDNQTGELKEFAGVKNYQEFKKRYWESVDNSVESGIIKEKSQTSIKEKRGQLDTGYKGKIPDEKLDEYNSKALEQIKKDTGYSDGDAEEFHKALQIYFGGDYEAVLSGNTGTAQTISKGIERMPVYDGKIYRGMTFSKYSDGNIEDFINLKPGDKIPEKGIITSWSSNKRVAESFGSLSTQSAESSSVILECENNNKGVGVQHISKFGAREAEVLSNAHYEVVDINVKSKYDYVSNRKDLLYFPEDLEDLENELKKQAVCIIKVKEV